MDGGTAREPIEFPRHVGQQEEDDAVRQRFRDGLNVAQKSRNQPRPPTRQILRNSATSRSRLSSSVIHEVLLASWSMDDFIGSAMPPRGCKNYSCKDQRRTRVVRTFI